MASPPGVAAPLGVWAAVTALLGVVAMLRLDWGWWIAPAAWGAFPVALWLLSGPGEGWGIAAPKPAARSAGELIVALAAVAGVAAWVATWAPAGPLSAQAIVVMCLWAPTVEELFFRGQLQGALRARWGAPAAVVLGAALFGVSHAVVGLSAIGLATMAPALLFGAIRERQRSLLPAVLLHAGANLALLLLSPATVVASSTP